jgi:peptidyl-prolyl cis-trans isomerase C
MARAKAPPRYHLKMRFLGTIAFVSWAACALAQTPPPKPASAAQPTVTLTVDNPTKPMPVVPPDRVVIAIGDLTITAAQFDQMIDSLPEQYKAIARSGGRKQFADNVVRIFVLAQEGRKRKLDESATYKTQAKFSEANVLAGMTLDDIKKNIPIDDAEVHKYFDTHKAEYEQVRARHILIRCQGSPLPVKPGQKDLSEAEALAKIEDIRAKIQGGADFAQLATQESDDTGSGANGGDLGSIRHGQMVPTFEEAAFALKPGELSEPVKSPFGYHLIRVESKESKTFEDMRAEIEKHLRPEQAQKKVEDLATKAGVVLDPEFFALEKVEKK